MLVFHSHGNASLGCPFMVMEFVRARASEMVNI